MVRHSPEATFYLLPFRAWELLLGSIMAMPLYLPPPSGAVAGGVRTLGIAMILAAVLLFRKTWPFPACRRSFQL